jgi:FlaA1/EpsC-like NDP-sugar epimerase
VFGFFRLIVGLFINGLKMADRYKYLLFLRESLLSLPRKYKQFIVLIADFFSAFLAVWLAYILRLDAFNIPRSSPQFVVYILSPLLLNFAYGYLGVYKAIFRYSGLAIVKTLCKGVLIQFITYSLILWILNLLGKVRLGSVELPKSILIIVPILSLILTGGVRALAYSLLTDLRRLRSGQKNRSRLLIYGAGSTGIQAYAAINNSSMFTMLGFIDDNPSLQGREIHGNRIYSLGELSEIIPKMGVSDIILAMPSLSRAQRFKVIENLRCFPVHVRSLPNIDDLASGQIRIQDVKELDITDLLGRTTVQPDSDLISHNISGKVILITGAGGSIGAELCRQILKASPSILILFDVSEFSVYVIEQELLKVISLGRYGQSTQIVALLGSVRDPTRVDEIVGLYKPQIIFHAAAYKHVPLVEINPFEGIKNNVFGTQILANAAIKFGVAHFVLISTDKAVRPTNIMGASKRLAELVLQAFASEASDTVFSMVRFGNVLGSSGSVVPLFRDQILHGGPLTITDARVTRFFMTIPEAAELVIQSSSMAKGGEVFVLDMGEPVKIYDLACRMIELSGLTIKSDKKPDGDIEIRTVGLRPGEKLYEELLIGDNPMPTQHPRIMQARELYLPLKVLKNELKALSENMQSHSTAKVIEQLKKLVSGFVPDSRSWD